MSNLLKPCLKHMARMPWMHRAMSSSGVEGGILLMNEDKGIRTLTLNDGRRRNVLGNDMISQLRQQMVDSPELRAIVLKANGTVFSSGHDLKELKATDTEGKVFHATGDLMVQMRNLPVPIIAQVDGMVAAAGTQLMASCDIVIASEGSTFSTPGASFGIFCSTPGIAVSRSVNLKTSALMLLTGRSIDAITALRSGLISLCVPPSQLQTELDLVIEQICSKSKPIVGKGKQFFYQQLDMNMKEAYNVGGHVMAQGMQHPDGQEGLDSFVQCRKPQWTHQPFKLESSSPKK